MLKILFVVVIETRSSVDELVTIMYFGWHSSAHLLPLKSATYSDMLTLITSMNFLGTIRLSPSQFSSSTQGDLFAQHGRRQPVSEGNLYDQKEIYCLKVITSMKQLMKYSNEKEE